MEPAKLPSFLGACVLCSLMFGGAPVAYCAAQAHKKVPLVAPAPPGLLALSGTTSYFGAEVPDWQRVVREWADASACERLALAEWLVEALGTVEPCGDSGEYVWTSGTDDLSLSAGRAKWSVEVILGVKLPGTVGRNASPEYIKNLREAGRLAVEAYRQGIMARAADHQGSPKEFGSLKRKYQGKMLTGPWAHQHPETEMDVFLLEWPPIGRRYEDLAAIIGAKGRQEKGRVFYTFDLGPKELRYTFVLRDGIIRSVRKDRY